MIYDPDSMSDFGSSSGSGSGGSSKLIDHCCSRVFFYAANVHAQAHVKLLDWTQDVVLTPALQEIASVMQHAYNSITAAQMSYLF